MRNAAWSYFFVLVFGGCATGHMNVAGHRDEVQFGFDVGGKPVVVAGIEVYDFDQGQRGETLCQLKSTSHWADDLASLNGWAYGHEIAKYSVSGCPKLQPGKVYGANVIHSYHCMMSIVFTVLPNGTVRTVKPGSDVCRM